MLGLSGCYTKIVSWQQKTGDTENGSAIYATATNIPGKIQKRDLNFIYGENETLRFQYIFYPVNGFPVSIGDLIDGKEIIEDLDGKYLLN